jgi:segregation and condensation protein B
MTEDLAVVSDPGVMDLTELPELRTALEAVLLVVDEPVDEVTLAQVVERPRDEVGRVLRDIAAEYDAAGRGFELRAVAGGWRLYTRASCAPYVERFVREGQPAKISQAALETLAVVAYRQPTTRSRIAGVRGVNVDAVMRTLVTRGLVAEVGVERETGAILYATTDHFLDRLGLASLEELPDISDLLPDHLAIDDDAAAG